MKHKCLCEEGFGEKGNYTIILPIDQGVEHGPHAAFYSSDHPEMMDVDYQIDYIAELLHEGLVGATALPQRIANLLVKKYPHLTKNVIMKLNHGNNLNKDIEPSQAIFASSYSARNMGAVGYTIYPGSSKQDQMIDQFSMVRSHKPGGVKTVLWSYPRGGDFDPISFETTLHAAYIAAQLEPDVIKVKIPANISGPDDLKQVVNAACGIPVVFSGGSHKNVSSVLLDAKCVAEAGGYGMIVGRNVFQRRPDEAKELLKEIHAIFADA